MGLSGSRARTQPLDTLQGGAAPPRPRPAGTKKGSGRGEPASAAAGLSPGLSGASAF